MLQPRDEDSEVVAEVRRLKEEFARVQSQLLSLQAEIKAMGEVCPVYSDQVIALLAGFKAKHWEALNRFKRFRGMHKKATLLCRAIRGLDDQTRDGGSESIELRKLLVQHNLLAQGRALDVLLKLGSLSSEMGCIVAEHGETDLGKLGRALDTWLQHFEEAYAIVAIYMPECHEAQDEHFRLFHEALGRSFLWDTEHESVASQVGVPHVGAGHSDALQALIKAAGYRFPQRRFVGIRITTDSHQEELVVEELYVRVRAYVSYDVPRRVVHALRIPPLMRGLYQVVSKGRAIVG